MTGLTSPKGAEQPSRKPSPVIDSTSTAEAKGCGSLLETINNLLLVLVLVAAFGFPWILVMLLPLDITGSVLESD